VRHQNVEGRNRGRADDEEANENSALSKGADDHQQGEKDVALKLERKRPERAIDIGEHRIRNTFILGFRALLAATRNLLSAKKHGRNICSR
jgi:hypothetical protein